MIASRRWLLLAVVLLATVGLALADPRIPDEHRDRWGRERITIFAHDPGPGVRP
jgi:hypothetical protein